MSNRSHFVSLGYTDCIAAVYVLIILYLAIVVNHQMFFSAVFIPHDEKLRIWEQVTDSNCRCTELMRLVWWPPYLHVIYHSETHYLS
jgi:hypothetical protein